MKNLKLINISVLLLASAIFAFSAYAADNFTYESRGKRDPFVPLIGQEKGSVAKLSEVTSVEDMKLEGIAVGAGKKKTAIINGEILKEGQKVGEIYIKTISASSVVVTIGGKDYTLKLVEEGGSKVE